MIAKSYQKDDVEIIMTKTAGTDVKYNVVRIVKGKESTIHTNLNYEDADDLYEYFMDMFLERDKK